MKKILFIISIILSVFMFSINTFAQTPKTDISNGISVIREKTVLLKSAHKNAKITFAKSDFDEIFGEKKYDFIKFCSLPVNSNGILRCNGIAVTENQCIKTNEIDKLDYIFTDEFESTFSFSNPETQVAYTCKMVINEEKRDNCECFNEKYETYKNTLIKANIETKEDMRLEIIKAPKNGVIEVTDFYNGEFIYRPKTNFSGTDKFTYCIKDDFGNKSKEKEIKIVVNKADKNLLFCDMVNNEKSRYCIKAATKKIMNYEIDEKGLPIFRPDESINSSDVINCIHSMSNTEKALPVINDTAKISGEELYKIIYDFIDNHPEMINSESKKEIEKVLMQYKDKAEINRSDLASIVCKILIYFPS